MKKFKTPNYTKVVLIVIAVCIVFGLIGTETYRYIKARKEANKVFSQENIEDIYNPHENINEPDNAESELFFNPYNPLPKYEDGQKVQEGDHNILVGTTVTEPQLMDILHNMDDTKSYIYLTGSMYMDDITDNPEPDDPYTASCVYIIQDATATADALLTEGNNMAALNYNVDGTEIITKMYVRGQSFDANIGTIIYKPEIDGFITSMAPLAENQYETYATYMKDSNGYYMYIDDKGNYWTYDQVGGGYLCTDPNVTTYETLEYAIEETHMELSKPKFEDFTLNSFRNEEDTFKSRGLYDTDMNLIGYIFISDNVDLALKSNISK